LREAVKASQRTAIIGLAIGGAASLALTLYAGRHQRSVILILLFALWVVSPFLGILCAHLITDRWLRFARIMLYALTLCVVSICPGIYAAVAFGYTTLEDGFRIPGGSLCMLGTAWAGCRSGIVFVS
jgi:hypothetical protein